ncbi:hypothetical protein OESDEN_20627, partial [Oesophagostomum dentatum]
DTSTRLPSLVDISEVTKASHIFEVIETNTKKTTRPPFNPDEILNSVPEKYCRKLVGPGRVYVSSPPYSKPMFVMFFEGNERDGLLRIRVSTDSQYSSIQSTKKLVSFVRSGQREGFSSLFNDLMEFIMLTENKKIQAPEKDSRQVIYRKNFLSNVISKTVAPFAIHSTVQDQLEYLSEYYVQSSSEGPSSEDADEEAPTVCSVCRMPDKTDHFPTKDGVMCRECLASFMTRQLRMKCFPIEIPIVVPPKCSPIELLYAVLPLPVISLLIKVRSSLLA